MPHTGVKLIMYNSSGGRGCGYGISQMEQKHQVRDLSPVNTNQHKCDLA